MNINTIATIIGISIENLQSACHETTRFYCLRTNYLLLWFSVFDG